MKGELRLHEIIFLAMLVILDVYLLNSNIVKNNYDVKKEDSSTANYLDISQIESDETTDFENVELEEEEVAVVFDGLTLEQLSEKLNRSLSSTISGKGYLIASYSIEKGVDPYMATAIMLHETGCTWGCSSLVRNCSNVGGQKGSGCGSYAYFNNLDEGIRAFIDNLERNYISYGLNTPEEINPKYAEDPNWSKKVNKYIEKVKAQ